MIRLVWSGVHPKRMIGSRKQNDDGSVATIEKTLPVVPGTVGTGNQPGWVEAALRACSASRTCWQP